MLKTHKNVSSRTVYTTKVVASSKNKNSFFERFNRSAMVHFGVLLLAVVALGAINVWQMTKYSQLSKDIDKVKLELSESNTTNIELSSTLSNVSSGERMAAFDSARLIRKISTIINIPSTEKPTLATITDKEALKNLSFFKDVEKGDRLLVFATAKKVVLFRESEGRVVNYGPIDSSNAPAFTGTKVQPEKPKGTP